MNGLSLGHIIIIVVVLLIFFGPSRLPALGQSIGKAIKGFKEGLNEIDAESKDVTTQSNNQSNNQSNTQSSNQINQNQTGMNQDQKVDSKTEKK